MLLVGKHTSRRFSVCIYTHALVTCPFVRITYTTGETVPTENITEVPSGFFFSKNNMYIGTRSLRLIPNIATYGIPDRYKKKSRRNYASNISAMLRNGARFCEALDEFKK